MNIYFLGGGNMATAIAGGLVKQDGYRVHIVERGAERRAQLVQELGVATSENLPKLSADDVLILAVKPQDMQAACQNIRLNGALVLSVAAGLSIDTLSHYLDGTRRIVRIMPNRRPKSVWAYPVCLLMQVFQKPTAQPQTASCALSAQPFG